MRSHATTFGSRRPTVDPTGITVLPPEPTNPKTPIPPCLGKTRASTIDCYRSSISPSRLANGGNRQGAIKYDMSMNPGDSNWAFSQFDNALMKTINDAYRSNYVHKGVGSPPFKA